MSFLDCALVCVRGVFMLSFLHTTCCFKGFNFKCRSEYDYPIRNASVCAIYKRGHDYHFSRIQGNRSEREFDFLTLQNEDFERRSCVVAWRVENVFSCNLTSRQKRFVLFFSEVGRCSISRQQFSFPYLLSPGSSHTRKVRFCRQ
jgi:hypothetical protein